jgi:hypothetical protein
LQLLKATGYVNDEGIVMPDPLPEQKAQRAPVTKIGTSMVVSKMETVKPAQPVVKESLTVESIGNAEPLADVSGELNDILRSLGSAKKVTKPSGQAVQINQKQQDNLSQPVGQFVPQEGQMFPPYITINNKQSKIKQSSTPSVTVGKVGLLPSTSSRGFVEPTKPQSLATMLQGFTTGKTKTPKLDSKNTAYIETALIRMKVTSPSERARYQSEIAYAATQGAFSETFSHTPLKAIRACLNLVEAGRWKANAGMYA